MEIYALIYLGINLLGFFSVVYSAGAKHTKTYGARDVISGLIAIAMMLPLIGRVLGLF